MLEQSTIAVWPAATEELNRRKPRAVHVTTAYCDDQVEDWFAAHGPAPEAADALCDRLAYGDRVLILPVRKGGKLPPSVASLMGRNDVFKVGVGIDDDVKTLSSQLQAPCRSFFELSLPHTIAVLAGTVANTASHDIGRVLATDPDNALPMQLRLQGITKRRSTSHAGSPSERRSLMELPSVQDAISKLGLLKRVNKISLGRLAEHWCGLASWKRGAVQTSDWGSLPLNHKQTKYAALDAWAGCAIADALMTAGALDTGLAEAISERS